MRIAFLVLMALAAAPTRADDSSEAAAHAMVRDALLAGATLPVEARPQQPPAAEAAHERSSRARQQEAERAAHDRAASHGARQTRDARTQHGAGAWTHGDATSNGTGMDSGWGCHDPAENGRTRDMHDGGMPDHMPHP